MNHEQYKYLYIHEICDPHRGKESSYKLTNLSQPDRHGNLSVFFSDNTETQIKNQFNQVPHCLAFIISDLTSEEPRVVMWSDNGEPLLSVGTVIKLTISGMSVSFNSTINFKYHKRLQICTNGTHATYYIDCIEEETKPFVMTSSSGIKSLFVLGKRNQTTFLYDEIFPVSMLCTN